MTANNEAITEFVRSTTNHTPSPETLQEIEDYRAVIQQVATGLMTVVPASRARSVALTHLGDAVHWGVKALILADA